MESPSLWGRCCASPHACSRPALKPRGRRGRLMRRSGGRPPAPRRACHRLQGCPATAPCCTPAANAGLARGSGSLRAAPTAWNAGTATCAWRVASAPTGKPRLPRSAWPLTCRTLNVASSSSSSFWPFPPLQIFVGVTRSRLPAALNLRVRQAPAPSRSPCPQHLRSGVTILHSLCRQSLPVRR